MTSLRIRGLLIGLGALGAVGSTPQESHAIFNWFSGCCGWGRSAMYAPAPTACCAPAPQTCCAPVTCAPPPCQQQCRYVPTTCYRDVAISVPVTTYRPFSYTDPCTGCTQCCMRPVTSYCQQTRRVPYTTYRMECAMVAASPCQTGCSSCQSGCSSCGGAAPAYYGQPAAAVYGGAPAAGSCCGGASPAPAYGAPTYGNPVPSTIQPGPVSGIPQTDVPTLTSPPTTSNSQYYDNSTSTQRPIPSTPSPSYTPAPTTPTPSYQPEVKTPATGTSPTSGPQLSDPNSRTASMRPLRRPSAWAYSYLSWKPKDGKNIQTVAMTEAKPVEPAAKPAAPAQTSLDDSGWEPVR